jgi:hypothetical protein
MGNQQQFYDIYELIINNSIESNDINNINKNRIDIV